VDGYCGVVDGGTKRGYCPICCNLSDPLNESTSQYRSAAGAKTRHPQLEVTFRADAHEVDIRRLLINGRRGIVGGPERNGIYRIYVRSSDLDEATLQLRKYTIVESVAPISSKAEK